MTHAGVFPIVSSCSAGLASVALGLIVSGAHNCRDLLKKVRKLEVLAYDQRNRTQHCREFTKGVLETFRLIHTAGIRLTTGIVHVRFSFWSDVGVCLAKTTVPVLVCQQEGWLLTL